jgi:hypothetical protein
MTVSETYITLALFSIVPSPPFSGAFIVVNSFNSLSKRASCQKERKRLRNFAAAKRPPIFEMAEIRLSYGYL